MGIADVPLLDIAELQPALRDLCDLQVDVKLGTPIAPKAPVVVTLFGGCPSIPEMVAVGDPGAINFLGAALTRIPGPEAVKNAKEFNFPKESLENYYEVMNILCGLLGRKHACHLTLKGFYLTAAALPADCQGLVSDPHMRDDYEITIKGYGSGKLSLLQR